MRYKKCDTERNTAPQPFLVVDSRHFVFSFTTWRATHTGTGKHNFLAEYLLLKQPF
jgi:hypothetical protein